MSSAQAAPVPGAQRLGYTPHVTLSIAVSDLDQALSWYQEMLGFELLYRLDDLGWAELQTGVPGVQLGVSVRDEVKRGGGATPTFGVRDLEAARADLEGRGVRFDGETTVYEGMVKLATFFDPDGNDFMLFESLTGG